jgi:hypothetical protein
MTERPWWLTWNWWKGWPELAVAVALTVRDKWQIRKPDKASVNECLCTGHARQ